MIEVVWRRKVQLQGQNLNGTSLARVGMKGTTRIVNDLYNTVQGSCCFLFPPELKHGALTLKKYYQINTELLSVPKMDKRIAKHTTAAFTDGSVTQTHPTGYTKKAVTLQEGGR